MKGILIDVVNQTVTEVVYDGNNSLNEWYRLIGCQMVEVAIDLNGDDDEKGNSVMVDEEGLLSLDNDSKFFSFEGAHQPFAGNGLIVGINHNTGDTVDVSVSVDDVKGKIKFLNVSQVMSMR